VTIRYVLADPGHAIGVPAGSGEQINVTGSPTYLKQPVDQGHVIARSTKRHASRDIEALDE
jgi:hypothetical protein